MERIYMPEKETFVSDEMNFGEFFSKYSEDIKNSTSIDSTVHSKKHIIKKLMNISDDQYTDLMKTCSLFGFKGKCNNSGELVIPIEGFTSDFNGYKIPPKVTHLASLNALRKRTNKESIVITKKLKYIGAKFLDEKIVREVQDKNREDMLTYQEYLLSVRVYIPAKHRSFIVEGDKSQRIKPLHVSQEFLIPGGTTLETLRDRIICQSDFQSIEGDVSNHPWTETTVRLMDVFKSAMFYIGNDFYIDKRSSTNKDYSAPIIEWGKKRKIKFGNVLKMENTYLCQLKLRLGYPYVYMHLCNCEHLIIFTDARLLHPRDIHIYALYPVMESYANLRGKYCKICKKRLAKYIVADSDRLPFTRMFMCAYCSFLYNYVGYKKVGEFKMFKYVDRIALL